MELGTFSMSLTVKDIHASIDFYSKLGFTGKEHCDPSQGWTVMQNGNATIGLFQGYIEKNTLTFNPGWDRNAQKLEDFADVRDIQKHLKSNGIAIDTEADETTSGPASIIVIDPDGNPVLIDQHV